MQFHSLEYLLAFGLLTTLYYSLPKKAQRWLLLCAGFLFYAAADPRMLAYLLLCIGGTYAAGYYIFAATDEKTRRMWLAIAVTVDVAALAVFKYTDFVLAWFSPVRLNLAVPLGISFITFQTVSYLVDLYKRKLTEFPTLFDYALYVSFFPNVAQGPIEKAGDMLPQLRQTHSFETEKVSVGAWMILFGLAMKLVIADRAAIPVNAVFSALPTSSGAEVLFATALFAVQLYADFAGYSLLAIGSAKVLGIELHRNFRQPYRSTSVSEFWRRWHISLNTWLKDYIYIPLGGSRCSTARHYLNVLIVFFVSGIWHGAAMGYVLWGVLNGVYVVLETVCHCESNEGTPFGNLMRRVWTSLLVGVSWIFFRAGTWQNVCTAFQRVFSHLQLREFLYSTIVVIRNFRNEKLLTVSGTQFIILALGVAVLALIDRCEDRNPGVTERLAKRPFAVRMAMLLLLLFAVLVFGIYGYGYQASSFVYTQF